MPRRWFACFAVAGLLLLAAEPCRAQAKPEQSSIEIVATRDAQVGGQIAIADGMGYFKEEGLQVTVHWVQSGGDVIQLLGSGTQYIGGGSTFAGVTLAAQQLPVSIIAGLADISGTQGFALGPNVKLASPRDLEGRKLAFTEGNPQTLILARLAKIYGFDFGRVTLVNMQPPEGVVASTKGDVIGLLSSEPNLYRLVSLGGSMYASGNTSWVSGKPEALGKQDQLLYLSSVLLAANDWIDHKPNTLKAVIRALMKATDLLATDRPRAVEQVHKQVAIEIDALGTIMAENHYDMSLNAGDALSLAYLSDWALGIKRIPVAVRPEDVIRPKLLEEIDPRLVTWHPGQTP